MGTRSRAEDFEDQTCAVNDLRLPAAFEIALLHRAQHTIDHHQTYPLVADHSAETLERPAPDEPSRLRASDPSNLGADDIEADCPCKADRFLKSRFGRTARYLCRLARARCFQRRV
jgi:hypothetical protein